MTTNLCRRSRGFRMFFIGLNRGLARTPTTRLPTFAAHAAEEIRMNRNLRKPDDL